MIFVSLSYSTVALGVVDEPVRRLHLQLTFKVCLFNPGWV